MKNKKLLKQECKIISGKYKNHIGTITKVNKDRVIVSGAGLVKKHIKANPQKSLKGGIYEKESFIHISNIKIISNK